MLMVLAHKTILPLYIVNINSQANPQRCAPDCEKQTNENIWDVVWNKVCMASGWFIWLLQDMCPDVDLLEKHRKICNYLLLCHKLSY